MKNNILKLIHKHQKFLLCTHVNPDPDAICSVLALGIFLRQKGKKVHMLFEEKIPERFQFFPTVKLAKSIQENKKYPYDVAIVLDCGDIDRIGLIRKRLDEDKPLVNIDHHVTNTQFGTINYVLGGASSTAEVLYGLFKAGKVKWNKALALNIYAGMMTDTGSFRYENTTSRTHFIASELMKFDIDVPDLFRTIYECIPMNDMAAFSEVINGFEVFEKGKIVCVEISRTTQEKFSENFDLRDAVFKYLRAIEGVEVIFIVTEVDKQTTRINFRSMNRVDVARLAAHFDGGGHQRASGCQIRGTRSQARQKVLKAIRRVL